MSSTNLESLVKKSEHILIPKKRENFSDDKNEYELTTNTFDPRQFSPPNTWSERLKNRIAQLDNIIIIDNTQSFTTI